VDLPSFASPSNPKVKRIRTLCQRQARDESGLFLVEGIRPVGEAIQAGASLAYLCYSPDRLTSDYARRLIRAQEARGVLVYAVAKEVFETLVDKENPQGILAVATGVMLYAMLGRL
jgi:TrmH family RNA methyltransferase